MSMFVHTSLVAVGSFSPMTYQPEWFDRYKILPIQDVELATAPQSFVGQGVQQVPMVSSQYTACRFKNFVLIVTPERFSCESTNPHAEAELQTFFSRTFQMSQALIDSVGFNFTTHTRFEGAADELLERVIPTPQHVSSQLGGNCRLSGSYKSIAHGMVLTITVEPSVRIGSGIYITTNYHDNIEDRLQDKARLHVEDKFHVAGRHFRQLITNLFGKAIESWSISL